MKRVYGKYCKYSPTETLADMKARLITMEGKRGQLYSRFASHFLSLQGHQVTE